MSADTIVVATSIPPTLSRKNAGQQIDAEYQRLCIASWRECGMRIVSLNDPSEIPALATRYPEVTFYPTQRSATAISGPKTPSTRRLPDGAAFNHLCDLTTGRAWRIFGVA